MTTSRMQLADRVYWMCVGSAAMQQLLARLHWDGRTQARKINMHVEILAISSLWNMSVFSASVASECSPT